MFKPFSMIGTVVVALACTPIAPAQVVTTVVKFNNVVDGMQTISSEGAVIRVGALSVTTPTPIPGAGTSLAFFRAFGDSSMMTAGLASATTGNYDINVTVTDVSSGQSGTIDITGTTTGTLSQSGTRVSLNGPFNTPGTVSLGLGAFMYTVTIPTFYALNSNNAIAQLDVPFDISSAPIPEPSSIVLGCLAAAFGGRFLRQRAMQTQG